MRIALVSEHANPLAALGGADAGGQNVHVAALAEGLADRGHHVTVFTRRDSPSAPAVTEAPGGYRVEHVLAGPPADVPKDELLPHMPAFARRLRQRLRQQPVDLVHAHFWMSGLAATTAADGLDVPVVQTFHALGSVKRRQQGAHDTSPRDRIRLERLLCRTVDHVIATCRDEVGELAALGLPAERVSVVPCGVDTSLFRPMTRTPSRRLRLLVVGRIVERKGIGNAIEALSALDDAELVVAGGPPADQLDADPEVARLKRVAAGLGVADRVRFLGSSDRAVVPLLMRDSDIVLAVPWYEPFGIVPVEAMACGRPVVGTAVGGLLDTVVPGRTGELVPPRRPDLVAQACRGLQEARWRRLLYGANGRHRAVSTYQWSHVVGRTERIYEQVLAGTPTGVLS